MWVRSPLCLVIEDFHLLHDYPSYAVATNRATSINAIAIMTNAVETNRILGSPFKLVSGTSLSSELYRDLFSP
jgi:hypothetical protein